MITIGGQHGGPKSRNVGKLKNSLLKLLRTHCNKTYGSTIDEIALQISRPRHGVMPGWQDRLDDVTIKQLTIYVHSLGGGE